MLSKRQLKSLSELDMKVVKSLQGDNLMSVSQVSKRLGENRQFILGVLESLRYRNMLKKSKVGQAIVYQIKKE